MQRRKAIQFGFTAVIAPLAMAQSKYPDRPVRLVVPFAVGGNTDVVARIYAQRLSDILGQQFIVENKTGSGVVVGTEAVAKSAPDGYTLLMGTSAHAVAPSLFPKLPFDPVKDLTPVTMVAEVPMVLSVNPRVAAKDGKEFVELLRKYPGRFNYGSSGNGGSLHMAVELLKYQEKVSAVHIPYRGAGPALTDAVAGQVDFIIDPISTSLPFIKAGRLRALAVTTAQRSPLLPEIKTMKEQGFSNYETSTWNMLFVPARTPEAIIQKISDTVMQINNEPATVKRLAELGVQLAKSNPILAEKFLDQERKQWEVVVKTAGIKPD